MSGTTKLNDLRIKTVFLSNLHDIIASSSRDVVNGPDKFLTAIRFSESSMLKDTFRDEVERYATEAAACVERFRRGYNAFSRYAETQRTKNRDLLRIEDVEKVKRQVTDTSTFFRERMRSPPVELADRGYNPTRGKNAIHYLDTLSKQLSAIAKRTERTKFDNSIRDIDEIRHSIMKYIDDLTTTRDPRGFVPKTFEDVIGGVDLDVRWSELMSALDTLSDDVRTRPVEYDGNRSTASDYITYIDNPPAWFSKIPPDAAITPNDNPISQFINHTTMYSRLTGPYVKLVEQAISIVGGEKSRTRDDEHKRKLSDLEGILVSVSSNLPVRVISLEGGAKPGELYRLSSFFNNNSTIVRTGDRVAVTGTDGRASSSSVTVEKISSGDRPQLPGVGFLYRRFDKRAAKMYKTQLEHFKTTMDDDGLMKNISRTRARFTERLDQIEKEFAEAIEKVESKDYAKRQYRDVLLNAYKQFCDSVRAGVMRFMRTHYVFVTRRHRDGLRYMHYWTQLKETLDADAVDELKQYMDLKDAIVGTSQKWIVNETRNEVTQAYDYKPADSRLVLTDSQELEVQNRVRELMSWLGDQTEKITNLYTRGRPPLLDSIRDPQLIVIYVLKLVRVGAAWYALRMASNFFQSMYDRAVYTEQTDPPSSLYFVGMVLGLDLACNVIVFALLKFCSIVFSDPTSGFPIDSQLLSAWLLDYGLSTLVVTVVSVIIAVVVQRKKYFRFKYEGDRGVRAMQQMICYVYCVLLFVPFFRLAHG